MQNLFKSLTSANMMLLVGITITGHILDRDGEWASRFEALVGITAIFCLLVHSIIYTYFIAAGKFVQSAVEDHGFSDATVCAKARQNKLRAFRYGFMALMCTAFATTLYLREGTGGLWVALAAYMAILMNIHAARKEWNYLLANGVLTDEVLRVLSRDTVGADAGTE